MAVPAIAFAAMGGIITVDPASAQSQVTPPTRGELLPPDRRRTESGATLTIDGGLERAPCALDQEEYSDLRFTLAGADFIGLDAVPGLSLDNAYVSYVGREQSLSVLCDIRARANSILRSRGYLATVEIPEQSLADGVPDFRVVFGRLKAVRVRGDAGPSEAVVAGYLEKLTDGEVFNTEDAERYLLLADDLPGLDVRLSLRPAADGDPGDLVGEIAVSRQRGQVSLSVQNLGSNAIGRFGGLIRGELYDLTGLGDRTSVGVYSTLEFEEQQTVQIGHDFAIGSEGLRLGGQFVYSQTDPDVGLQGFELESETVLAAVKATYPLKRSRRASIFADVGFEYVDQDVTVNDVPLTQDRVRTAFARVEGDWTDAASIRRVDGYTPYEPKVRARLALEARQGLGVFSASPDCRSNPLGCIAGGLAPPSRIEADPTPFVARAEAGVEYRPIPNITFSLQANAQASDAPLPAFEEFAAGNYSIGRGYDPGAVLGDSGIGVQFELRAGSLAPKDVDAVAVQPYVFTDAAWAWNNDPSRIPGNPDRLWSAGGGVRAAWGSRVQADLFVAAPITRPDLAPRLGDVRVLFTLTARLFPWSY
ncbi:ShlB/FhaC/HecB family hemolysin secretion/activation protein [Erythrobacter sp. THAF29]|uniref:ShlB/FhaC/HecB family hemolysin secretion/activation protein n=1 Tax=Erythrobacter sp. THAF29 TaxID=2587851 RepID=UPI0012688D47|nr:ShlB/FhaC/HecB family hemolysin secretion/activation protein [Erythrobacter sp. THAF29]